MISKKTTGKQKIPIQKIEKDEDRMVSFAKRRNGIYTKLSELSVLCGADVAYLVHSGSGKPYTFGNPSFETVAKRFLDGENSSSTSSVQRLIMDSYHKNKIEELCRVYNNELEKANAEEKKGAITADALHVEEDAWWKVDLLMVKDMEEVKQLMKKHEDLYEKLCVEAEKRCSQLANDPCFIEF